MRERSFDVSKVYKPMAQQARAHESAAMYRLFGGAAGGGKTEWLIWEAILRSLKYDFPITGALFRRSYPELEATIIRRMLDILPTWAYKYNKNAHLLTLFNGSRVEFCYAENDDDAIRYQSREWDWIGIDELTHFSEFRFLYLISRLRTTKPIKVKFFAATNPGGIGHAWVKKRWVTKDCDAPGYRPEQYEFIPAKVTDNLYLMRANPEYVDKLKMLPDNERRALLDGDWDVYQGQFFTEWSPQRHIVQPFDIPTNWKLYLSWDDGVRAPRSVHLYAVDNDKHVWCIWEYYRKDESVIDAARNIKDELTRLNYWDRIERLVVDPSMKKNDGTTSAVEILEQVGFGFKNGEIELANNDRKEGWRIVRMYMSHKPYEEPLIKIFSTCTNMIRTLPEQIFYDGGTFGKKEDMDSRGEDHAVDDMRYVLMSIHDSPTRFGGSSSDFQILRRSYQTRTSLT